MLTFGEKNECNAVVNDYCYTYASIDDCTRLLVLIFIEE